ncbi:hypothetical protein GUITHDRAFT_101047 [Guillardia theta CCMP2712]|uniref:Pseudouridine synthase RsuA/RluA-like domain-containing protein n=1 Tax=Guillardia theta (strain CCMP2712) TaxID=905079 RepID=L1JYS2_GUITC|nr:hypothetical protein GUITHDRAFT_101047 [Guillardia theta CCMP2712]EKX53345.1 hypothetical protein GUITHDRAFT_101047 [Guillardia theta CCMP2712]|eukprot:XP_005840325.1 hypothetical protein GUITHDRAFT_101047 [Guillardia theta CCMP2712]
MGEGEQPRKSSTPKPLTDDEKRIAQSFISPQLLKQFTQPDGTVDYKALSKTIPLQADHGPLQVLYEDDDLIFVSKPPGMQMNPPHRFLSGTLLNRVIGHLGKTPFVIHRLDMWTSGVVVYAKEQRMVPLMHEIFRERKVVKEYFCLVDGSSPEVDAFVVNAAIDFHPHRKLLRCVSPDGKPSETRFEVLGRSRTQSMTLLRALPKTGRTHQIRIHAMHAGLPIVGDNVYGKEAELYTASDEELKESSSLKHFDAEKFRTPLKLHARSLQFTHPLSQHDLKVVAPIPDHFRDALEAVGMQYVEETKDL